MAIKDCGLLHHKDQALTIHTNICRNKIDASNKKTRFSKSLKYNISQTQLGIRQQWRIEAQFRTTEARPLISFPLFPCFLDKALPHSAHFKSPSAPHPWPPICRHEVKLQRSQREARRGAERQRPKILLSSQNPGQNLQPSHQLQTPSFSPVVCRGGSEHSCRNISPGKFKWGRNGEGETEKGESRSTIVRK